MKGRNESTGVETTQVLSEQVKHRDYRRRRRSFSATESLLQRQLRPARLAFAVAALATVFLLGIFLVSYGSKLYQNWSENRLLDRATALRQEGKLSNAAQITRELLGGIRILCRRCRSSLTQRKDKILKTPFRGVSA